MKKFRILEQRSITTTAGKPGLVYLCEAEGGFKFDLFVIDGVAWIYLNNLLTRHYEKPSSQSVASQIRAKLSLDWIKAPGISQTTSYLTRASDLPRIYDEMKSRRGHTDDDFSMIGVIESAAKHCLSGTGAKTEVEIPAEAPKEGEVILPTAKTSDIIKAICESNQLAIRDATDRLTRMEQMMLEILTVSKRDQAVSEKFRKLIESIG